MPKLPMDSPQKQPVWTPYGVKKQHWNIRSFKNRHGNLSFMLDFIYPDGERVRKTFPSRGDADDELQRMLNALYGCEEPTFARNTSLTQEQVNVAAEAFSVLQGEPGFKSIDLLDAAREFVVKRRAAAAMKQICLRDLIREFLADKAKSGRAERTLVNLKHRLSNFASTLPDTIHVSAVTSDQVRNWYQRHNNLLSQRDDRAALSNLFSWACHRGWLQSSPLDKTEHIKVTFPDPEILPIKACSALLQYARSEHKGGLLPYIVLGLFAGIRPAEILRLTWEQVDLESKLVIIRGGAAKLRQRRTVELHDTAIKWLTLCKGQPIIALRRLLDAAKRAAGYAARVEEGGDMPTWPPDALRHTAISYHYALYQNEGKTASWAGNSPEVIHRHYKGLVKPSDVASFWELVP